MKIEECDSCKKREELDSSSTGDWTDVEYKGRTSAVKHIRKASYCPACTGRLQILMRDFNKVTDNHPG
jgi:hypothetical protein